MNSALRPMSTAEVLDRTFHLYRNNFVLFVGISMVAYILRLVMHLAMLGVFGAEAMQGQTVRSDGIGAFLVIMVVSMVIYLIVHSLASGATVHAVSRVHLEQKASIHQSYKEIGPIFFRLLRIVISVSIRAFGPIIIVYLLFVVVLLAAARQRNDPSSVMILGLSMLILVAPLIFAVVWMIRVFCRYAFAVPACALEKVSAGNALKRSKFLTKNSLSRLFLVALLTGMIGFALGYVFQLPIFIANHRFWMDSRMHLTMPYLLWTYFADFAAGALAAPIATIAIALLYYDERIRKEAFDLQWMMQSLAPAVSQATAATSSGASIAT